VGLETCNPRSRVLLCVLACVRECLHLRAQPHSRQAQLTSVVRRQSALRHQLLNAIEGSKSHIEPHLPSHQVCVQLLAAQHVWGWGVHPEAGRVLPRTSAGMEGICVGMWPCLAYTLASATWTCASATAKRARRVHHAEAAQPPNARRLQLSVVTLGGEGARYVERILERAQHAAALELLGCAALHLLPRQGLSTTQGDILSALLCATAGQRKCF